MTKSSQSVAERHIPIGKVGAPHGVRGELKVFPMTDFPERFQNMKCVFVAGKLLEIKSVRYQNDLILICFKDYEIREKAATLTGNMLSVPREEAMPLPEGQFYTFDIIGLKVFDPEGNDLGTVRNVLKTGSNDVYVVVNDETSHELLVPALKSVVKKISLEEQMMVVDMPEVME